MVHIPATNKPIHIPIPREQLHHTANELTLLTTSQKRSYKYQKEQFLFGCPAAMGESLFEVSISHFV